MRLDAGFKTGRELADVINLHPSKVSRAERHGLHLSEDDIRAWAIACQAEEQIPELIAEHRQVEEMWSEHRRALRAGQKQIQKRGLPLYQSAELVRAYEAFHVPGILQTYRYALTQRVVTARLHELQTKDVEEAARNRLASQFLITEGGGPTFSFVLEAISLYTLLEGDVDMMSEQLDFLIEAAAKPHVAIGIIPLGSPRSVYPGEGFYLFDERQVRQDFWSGALITKRPEDVAYFGKVFRTLRQHAVYGSDAQAQIETAREFLQSSAMP
jgi:Domain of unknown function (DUF5753)